MKMNIKGLKISPRVKVIILKEGVDIQNTSDNRKFLKQEKERASLAYSRSLAGLYK